MWDKYFQNDQQRTLGLVQARYENNVDMQHCFCLEYADQP